MSIGAIFIGLLLLGLTAYAATLPWRRQAGTVRAPLPVLTPAAALEDQAEAGYAALADLDFDRRIGKLNGDDYRRVRGQLMAQTVAVLKQIDAMEADVEGQVEALVSMRRAQRAGAAVGGNGHGGDLCPSCAAPSRAGDRFCGRCGAELGRACPACGRPVKSGDLYCAGCGSAIAARAAAA